MCVGWFIKLKKKFKGEESAPKKNVIINSDRLRLGECIGEGEYGKVYKATLSVGFDFQTVAVKTLKDENDERRRQQFLEEAKVLHEYRHENIVNLIGVVSDGALTQIVLEYAGAGSLKKYLVENGSQLGLHSRYRFASECANGMKYLESVGCIHRDVAARNVLLTKNELKCKIADFGLSMKNARLLELAPDKMPIKYLSPEVLKHQQYSIKSDVWAFGILIYEIFTDGAEPYPGMNHTEVKARLTDATKYRMEIPIEVPPNTTKLMMSCWAEDANRRPSFKDLHKILSDNFNDMNFS